MLFEPEETGEEEQLTAQEKEDKETAAIESGLPRCGLKLLGLSGCGITDQGMVA